MIQRPDEKMKIEIIYGSVCVRPEQRACIVVPEPTRWQLFCAFVEMMWAEVILPAALFALAYTFLMWPLLR